MIEYVMIYKIVEIWISLKLPTVKFTQMQICTFAILHQYRNKKHYEK